jgi:Mor family transcriptional regulator
VSFGFTLVKAIQAGCDVNRREAVDLAKKIIAGGAKHGLAGSVHYWPKRFRGMTPSERNAAIRETFNGRNLQEVCRRFDVSAVTVYRALHQDH